MPPSARGGVWVAQGAAKDASIGGGTFTGGGKACTKHTGADLQNGGQAQALCFRAEREERSD